MFEDHPPEVKNDVFDHTVIISEVFLSKISKTAKTPGIIPFLSNDRN